MLTRLSLLILIAFTMSACAKKNSEFAARYAKNKMGATVVDGVQTQEAGERAEAYGLEADIVDIQRHFVPAGEAGPNTISAQILVNNQQISVRSYHLGTEIVNGKAYVGNYMIIFHAMCANSTCNPYYASLQVYQNDQMLIQEGVRKYFDKFSPEHSDVYQWFTPQKALPLIGRDMYDPAGMVGFLNSFADNSGQSFSSGFVK